MLLELWVEIWHRDVPHEKRETSSRRCNYRESYIRRGVVFLDENVRYTINVQK